MDAARLGEVVNSRCDYGLTLVGEADQGETSRHDLLAGYDARTRRMLDLIREVGSNGPDELAGDDLVHPDYTPPNVLFDNTGQISAIVDWNGGVARGDRCFALVGLRADLTLGAWMQANHPQVLQEAIDRLDEYSPACSIRH